ncbi:hypothetical protein [Cellulosimicrobium cellulans]|uniref:hypothetical protein n=1 Tax=Cellulosimicrobium cellulans TaxID=1710 RepID=UPI0012FD52C3|nr:hypothetical protein [Cellulosimicrobium cellulans]
MAQPFRAEGAPVAEGIRSQLGRPQLDLLTVLVREAAQNSWDGRSDTVEDVRFGLDLYTVSPAHAQAWRSSLVEGSPQNREHFPLRRSLKGTSIRVLAVSDRGTKGLGGPTRADVVTSGRRDFVTFVRNVGEARDTELGGGTYGFGKGIFFMLSKPHAILIHTRTEHEGHLQTRLIGSVLAHSYVAAGPEGEARFTGRHWWGTESDDVVEPLLDAEADEFAARLGLIPFASGETGTTIYVIDPEIDDSFEDQEEVGRYLAETIVWQLWPKMLERANGLARMRFHVNVDGVSYPVPDPETTTPISLFVTAFRQLDSGEARPVEHRARGRRLGHLGVTKTVLAPWDHSKAAASAGFERNLVHHVCLMRAPELVVNYLAGPEPSSEYQGYAGVFRADTSLDGVFAKAEPPTHDAWNPDSLPRDEATLVRVAFTRIREAQAELGGLRAVVDGAGEGLTLGAASNYFSRLMRGSAGFGGAVSYNEKGGESGGAAQGAPEVPGSAAGNTRASGGGTAVPGSRSHLRVEYVGEPQLRRLRSGRVVVQEFRLPAAAAVTLEARLKIVTGIEGGGRESGGSNVGVVGWEGPDGDLRRSISPEIVSDGEGTWKLLVQAAPDMVIDLDIHAVGVRN